MLKWRSSGSLRRLKKLLADELELARRNGNDVMISCRLAANLVEVLDQAIRTEEGHET